jgi:hypothetical protein
MAGAMRRGEASFEQGDATTQFANALLISKAPELVELLEKFAAMFDDAPRAGTAVNRAIVFSEDARALLSSLKGDS